MSFCGVCIYTVRRRLLLKKMRIFSISEVRVSRNTKSNSEIAPDLAQVPSPSGVLPPNLASFGLRAPIVIRVLVQAPSEVVSLPQDVQQISQYP